MSSDQALSDHDISALSAGMREQASSYSSVRTKQGIDDEVFDVAGARAALDRTARDLSGRYMSGRDGAVPTHEVAGAGPTLIYLHGGGFVGGTVSTHGHIPLQVAEKTGVPICFPEYRLAPEHPFPAAFDDVETVLSSISGPVLIAGDSVGATLALHLALRHPDRDRIRALALLAPMLAFSVETSDYLRTHGRARGMIAESVGPADRANPMLNPLAQDLSRLPPTLVQVGGADYVKPDGIAFTTAAANAGAPVILEHWPNMPHVWHRYAPDAPEAARSLSRVAAFLSSHSTTETNDTKN